MKNTANWPAGALFSSPDTIWRKSPETLPYCAVALRAFVSAAATTFCILARATRASFSCSATFSAASPLATNCLRLSSQVVGAGEPGTA